MQQAPARAFLDAPLPAQRRAERFPLIVVLAHGVVQPAHVVGMAHGVARIAQRDDLIDRTIVVAHAHVGEPRRKIRGALAAEAILRREHELGLVARIRAAPEPAPVP